MKKYPLISTMVSDVFLVSLFFYLAAVRIDLSMSGLISRAFPLNILLLIVVLSGLANVLVPPKDEQTYQKPAKRLWVYVVLISIFIGSIVVEILKNVSPWALLIGCAAGFIVFFVGFAIIRQDYE
ncbi:MAG: hypothetical protein AAB855_04280 [Patescibacteria group bacterium]